MLYNFWLAKPYGLANQKLCYSTLKFTNLGEKDREFSWEWLMNTDASVKKPENT